MRQMSDAHPPAAVEALIVVVDGATSTSTSDEE
jgi:hypothetical protein